MIIVNGWKPLTIITKHSILDVAAALDPPLLILFKMSSLQNLLKESFFSFIDCTVIITELIQNLKNTMVYFRSITDLQGSVAKPNGFNKLTLTITFFLYSTYVILHSQNCYRRLDQFSKIL